MDVKLHPDDLETCHGVECIGLRNGGTSRGTSASPRRRRWFLFRVNPLRDENEIVKWYGVNTDIEDLKRAETELLRGAALLHHGGQRNRQLRGAWTAMNSSGRIRCIGFEFEPGTTVTLESIASRASPDDLPLMGEMVSRAQAGRDFSSNTGC
jgi:hypothetical protein